MISTLGIKKCKLIQTDGLGNLYGAWVGRNDLSRIHHYLDTSVSPRQCLKLLVAIQNLFPFFFLSPHLCVVCTYLCECVHMCV